MKQYSVRPANFRDLKTVFEIIANQMLLDFGPTSITLEDLRNKWEQTDLENDTLTAFADGRMAGYAELRDSVAPFIYLENRNNVDLAFQLLMLLEQKAASQATGKLELLTQISERNKTLLQLFASNGYQSDLSFLTMETHLDGMPSTPVWPYGIHVRTFVPGQDEQATYQTDEQAGKDKGYHHPLSYEQWVKRMGLSEGNFDPTLWFLACAGEKVIGVALNTQDSDPNTVWVDHLSVLREWRKKGIGKALLIHSFGEFYKRELRTVKLNVDSKSLTNAPQLYESVGMRTVQKYHIYKKEIQV